jgi:iron(III) transport system permease protein
MAFAQVIRTRRWRPAAGLAALALAVLAPLAWADERTAHLAANTLLLAAATVALSVPLGSAIAFALARTDLPGRRLYGWLLTGFLFLPLCVQAGAWQAAFGFEGWYTLWQASPAWLDGWRGAIWVHAVAALPWVVLIVATGLMTVERELEELALLDAGAAAVAWRVTLRRSAGAIGVAALWVAVTTAAEMAVTDFFQVRTYAEELYTQFALGDVPLADADDSADATGPLGLPPGVVRGMAASAWMAVAALVLMAGLAPMTRVVSVGRPLVFRWRRWRWLAAGIAWTLASMLLLLPLASLTWKAGIVVDQTTAGRVRSWSLAKCAAMVLGSQTRVTGTGDWRLRPETADSLLIDGAAATAAVVLAFPLAWLARRPSARARLVLAAVAGLLAVPGPVVGLAIIAALNRPDHPWLIWLYDRTLAAPCLAATVHALPLAVLVLWPALRALPEESLENAAVDGAGWWARLTRVVLPRQRAALAVAWLVSFAWSLGELDASLLVAPPGVQTLAVHIFGLLHFGVEDQVAGICLALYLMAQLLTGLVWLLASRGLWPRHANACRLGAP